MVTKLRVFELRVGFMIPRLDYFLKTSVCETGAGMGVGILFFSSLIILIVSKLC